MTSQQVPIRGMYFGIANAYLEVCSSGRLQEIAETPADRKLKFDAQIAADRRVGPMRLAFQRTSAAVFKASEVLSEPKKSLDDFITEIVAQAEKKLFLDSELYHDPESLNNAYDAHIAASRKALLYRCAEELIRRLPAKAAWTSGAFGLGAFANLPASVVAGACGIVFLATATASAYKISRYWQKQRTYVFVR